jgi:hypothetical protein
MNKPFALAYFAALACLGCKAPAQRGGGSSIAEPLNTTAIIQAAFAGTNNATMEGQQPDVVNLPGGQYSIDGVNTSGTFSAFNDTGQGVPEPAMHVYDNGSSVSGSVAISLKSNGSYTKPRALSIQAQIMTLNPSTILFLGFYSSPPANGSETLSGMTGLALDTQTGALTLVANGVNQSTIAFTGTFNTGAFNTVSYSVDTTTGGISGVSLTGSSSNYNFSTSAFTDAATQYVAMGTEAGGPAGACSYFDNLLVSSTTISPPPNPPVGVAATVR